ncbi:MAG: hypothetical protein O6700_04170 [Gammaproteobacteria bacterium]|nr:hypothetical protein [Gammaproteobacteria bacterium]
MLKIRDGEPVDADARAYVEADPSARRELRRLRQTQQALQDLPGFAPPAGAWDRVILAAEEDAASRARRGWHWPLRGAIAASVAILAVLFVARPPQIPAPMETGPATIVGEAVPNNRISEIVGTPSYASLALQSARLDRALGSINYQPMVMRASTASTITSLEDHVAVLDDRLMFANDLNLSPPQREALWQQRVDVMSALFYMRFAQAQRSGY